MGPLYKSNGPLRTISAHCLFVINDSKRWTFSEYTMPHDGIGVIRKWIEGLDDEVQAEFEVRFLQWAANDKWLDLYSGTVEIDKHGDRFEELIKVRDIAITVNAVPYRILGGTLIYGNS